MTAGNHEFDNALEQFNRGEITHSQVMREIALSQIDFAINAANTNQYGYGDEIIKATQSPEGTTFFREDSEVNGLPLTIVKAFRPGDEDPLMVMSLVTFPVANNLVMLLEKPINPNMQLRQNNLVVREVFTSFQLHQSALTIRRFITETSQETLTRVLTNKFHRIFSKSE